MQSSWVSLAFRSLVVPSFAAFAVFLNAGLGEAQTFRFQLQPLCDTVVLTFVPSASSSVLGVVGYDDNCGQDPRSPISGTAIVNPDGSVTMGFTTSLPFSVYERTDVGLQTNVEIPANSFSGVWRDDDGYTGTFQFDLLDQKSG
jgi:hypothetical protein